MHQLKIILVSLTVLAVTLADVIGHTFLEYGVPTMGEFPKDKTQSHYYIDVAAKEKLSLSIEAHNPVQILVAQSPFPQRHNASWEVIDYFELGPENPNYFPGRYYITLLYPHILSMKYTVTGYSDTPMLEEIPTTGIIHENGYAFFSYPVCTKGKLTVEVFSEGTTQGMYLSQQWAHPTSAEGRHSYKTTSGRIQIDVKSPGRMYIGVKGKIGDDVSLIGTMDNEIETISEGVVVSGSILRGCTRRYMFDSVYTGSGLHLTIMGEQYSLISEVFIYLSHGDHNIFPDRYDYDDVSLLEVGAAAHFSTFEFIDGTAYLGIEAPDASPWIGSKYSFQFSQHHEFIYVGYETRVTIPSTTEGALFVISRAAEFPVRYIAAEVAFGDVRERDNHDYLIMGSHDDPNVEGEGSCTGTWGYMECYDSFFPLDQIRYFIRVVYKDLDASEAPSTDAKILTSFVYTATLYSKYEGNIEKDEFVSFVVDIPSDESGFDVYVRATTNGDGFIELYGGWDRIPTGHKSFHKWRGVPSGYQREIRIPSDEIDFGKDATIYFSIRGTTKATFSLVTFTGRHIPLPNDVRYYSYIAPMSVVHYIYYSDSDNESLLFSLQTEDDVLITAYVSNSFQNPDADNHDYTFTSTSGPLLVQNNGPLYNATKPYFLTLLSSQSASTDSDIAFELFVARVTSISRTVHIWEKLSPLSERLYSFNSYGFHVDHFLQILPYSAVVSPMSVYVSSSRLPSFSDHDYSANITSDLHTIEMLSDKRMVPGTHLVSVKDHMGIYYRLSLMSSVHLLMEFLYKLLFCFLKRNISITKSQRLITNEFSFECFS
ncbi:hypothetical protein GEMRC1_013146 [Eukaryota sp. GEM-RC1]